MHRPQRILERLGLRSAPSVVHAPLGLARGRVRWELRNADTGLIEQRGGPFRNLITDAGLDFFGRSADATFGLNDAGAQRFQMAASTDSTAPANGDTTLAGEFTPTATHRTSTAGSPATSVTYVSGTPDYIKVSFSRVFSSTQVVGSITKLAVYSSAATGPILFAETLVKDVAGNATSIPKASGQTLTVIWEFDWVPPQGDTVSTVTINGVSTTLTSRAALISASASGWNLGPGTLSIPSMCSLGGWGSANVTLVQTAALVARTAAPTASNNATLGSTVAAYVAGTFRRDWTGVSNSAAAIAALGVVTDGNGATNLASRCHLQLGFSPSVAAGVSFTVRLAWGRYP